MQCYIARDNWCFHWTYGISLAEILFCMKFTIIENNEHAVCGNNKSCKFFALVISTCFNTFHHKIWCSFLFSTERRLFHRKQKWFQIEIQWLFRVNVNWISKLTNFTSTRELYLLESGSHSLIYVNPNLLHILQFIN